MVLSNKEMKDQDLIFKKYEEEEENISKKGKNIGGGAKLEQIAIERSASKP